MKISDPFLKSFKSISFTVKEHWRFHYTLNERDFFFIWVEFWLKFFQQNLPDVDYWWKNKLFWLSVCTNQRRDKNIQDFFSE